MDPGMTGFPLEHRHPLLDLRLVRFALSLAPVPWCVDKHLFREAMRDALPPVILRRPKEPLAGDPITAGLATMSGRRSW
jgi:asparagine synthase (glutamine-hydrolysing)